MQVTVMMREKHEVRTDLRISIEDFTRTLPPRDPKAVVSQWRSNG
jgi:hypothetical protein